MRAGSASGSTSRRTAALGAEISLVRPLALVQPRSVRVGVAFPWRRAAVFGAALLAGLGLLYLGARATPVFAVRSLEISGAPRQVRQEARATASRFVGKSLVGFDGAELIRELEVLPSVRSATYDRDFPNTLRIVVRPEVPVAVMEVGEDGWVLSERGRVIRPAASSARRLPRFRLPVRVPISLGSFVDDPAARTILTALADLPPRFPARVEAVQLENGTLTLELEATWGTPELRLGEPVDVAAKLAAGALVLRRLPASERPTTDYLDVSLPERVVVGSNSQPEG
jgi:cell division protein FtsQ